MLLKCHKLDGTWMVQVQRATIALSAYLKQWLLRLEPLNVQYSQEESEIGSYEQQT